MKDIFKCGSKDHLHCSRKGSMSFPPNLSVIVTKIYLPSLGVEANLNQSYWILTEASKYLISKCFLALLLVISKCFLALLFAVQGSHICRKCSPVAVFALFPPWWSSYHLFTNTATCSPAGNWWSRCKFGTFLSIKPEETFIAKDFFIIS